MTSQGKLVNIMKKHQEGKSFHNDSGMPGIPWLSSSEVRVRTKKDVERSTKMFGMEQNGTVEFGRTNDQIKTMTLERVAKN